MESIQGLAAEQRLGLPARSTSLLQLIQFEPGAAELLPRSRQLRSVMGGLLQGRGSLEPELLTHQGHTEQIPGMATLWLLMHGLLQRQQGVWPALSLEQRLAVLVGGAHANNWLLSTRIP